MSYEKIASATPAEMSIDTAQTPNMVRKTGVTYSNLWWGSVSVEAGKVSEPHHHGQAETAAYVLNGQTRIYFGIDYKEYLDAKKGDFVFVPPYVPHIVENTSASEKLEFVVARTHSNLVVNLDRSERVDQFSSHKVAVTRSDELDGSTLQTKNLPRKTGVSSPSLWLGYVVGAPGLDSGKHHHGVCQTGGYILKGSCRVYFGDNNEEYLDFNEGDFIGVPPFIPHLEKNNSVTETVEFITVRNPSNIVVNLD